VANKIFLIKISIEKMDKKQALISPFSINSKRGDFYKSIGGGVLR